MSSPQAIHSDYWIQEKLADNHIQKYCDKIRYDIEGKMNRKFVDFIAINYVRQALVGATPYIVKIHDSDHVYVHAKFCVPLMNDVENDPRFEGVQDNKKKDELIIPF